MVRFYILLGLSLIQAISNAQHYRAPSTDSLSQRKFLTMVNFYKDESYLSFLKGFGNQRPILFEAQLSPSYFVTHQHKKWALMINPQVQIRMLNQYSVPIQVPSYHFYLTYYHSIDFWPKTIFKKVLYDEATWFASIAHHSNGQSGNFYVNDSTKEINLTGGSFSVNFIQLGLSTYSMRPSGSNYFSLREFKIHTELYPSSWCDPNLNGIYGFYRLFGTFGFAGPWRLENKDWLNRWLQNSSIEIKTGWIFGTYAGYNSANVQRLILDINYKYYPPWFDEIAFFLRFYSGQDYYNIYFEKYLVNLTVGITSNTIKLSNAIRYLGNGKRNPVNR